MDDNEKPTTKVRDVPHHMRVTLLPVYEHRFDKSPLEELAAGTNERLEHYHKRQLFTPGKLPAFGRLHATRNDVEQARDQIATALQQIEHGYAKLDAINSLSLEADQAEKDTSEREWYEHSDLFRFKVAELDVALTQTPIRYSSTFATYLFKKISAAIIRGTLSNPIWRTDQEDKKAQRMLKAFEEAQDGQGVYHQFQLCARLLCEHHDKFEGMYGRDTRPRTHFRTRLIRMMRITIAETSRDINLCCVEVRHHIWKQYSTIVCDWMRPNDSFINNQCFHRAHVGLLFDLQKRAHTEIVDRTRHMVQLVCHERLPQELADQIFDTAWRLNLDHDTIPRDNSASYSDAPQNSLRWFEETPLAHAAHVCGRVAGTWEWLQPYNAAKERKQQILDDSWRPLGA